MFEEDIIDEYPEEPFTYQDNLKKLEKNGIIFLGKWVVISESYVWVHPIGKAAYVPGLNRSKAMYVYHQNLTDIRVLQPPRVQNWLR